jgi:glycogen synthase
MKPRQENAVQHLQSSASRLSSSRKNRAESRISAQPRVLMLGWEYPPRFAGGLGKACRGFSQAMARQGAQVFFVLPTFPERLSEHKLEVVGARECLIEAGWTGTEAQPFDLSMGPSFDPDENPELEVHEVWMRSRSTILQAAGAQKGKTISATVTQSQSRKASSKRGGLSFIESDAELFPYGLPPDTPVPEHIKKIFGSKVFSTSGHSKRTQRALEILRRQAGTPSGAAKGTPMEGSGYEDHQFNEDTEETADSLAGPQAGHSTHWTAEGAGGGEIYGKNLWSEIERFCFSVRQLAESHDVDVVHAHDWMTFPAAFEFQRITGVPVFLHVHATEYDRSGDVLSSEVFKIEREGFRRATHIFAVSRYTAGIIERLYGINRKKISVLYNAPDEDIKELKTSPDAPREPAAVFLGRLTYQKGPEFFLKAAALVAQADPRARFLIIGTGDLFEAMVALAHQLGIQDRVEFTGFMKPAEVDRILSRSKVLVMPSISEPFGLVALEAIHNGIPVILSKQSGVREVLHRALQVDFWDHEKLADQMIAALRLPDLSRQLVADGMEQVQELSWDDSAVKALHGYKRYMGRTYAQAVRGGHGH